MPSLTDARFDTLRALGFTGSTSDMLLAWLQTGGPAVGPVTGPLKTLPDAWRSVLEQLAAEAPGTPPAPSDHVINAGNNGGFISGYRQAEFGTLTNDAPPGVPKIIRMEGDTLSFNCRVRLAGDAQIPGVDQILLTGTPMGGGGDIPATHVWDGQDYSVNDFALAQLFYSLGEGANQDVNLTYVSSFNEAIAGDYHRNDWWYAWLGMQGYTGSINDRELQFWTAIAP